MPPQTPNSIRLSRASARHSVRTGQPRQISFARFCAAPCTNNASGSALRQAARAVQSVIHILAPLPLVGCRCEPRPDGRGRQAAIRKPWGRTYGRVGGFNSPRWVHSRNSPSGPSRGKELVICLRGGAPYVPLVPRNLCRVMGASEDRASVIVKLFRLLGAAVFAGVLVGLLALPGVGSVGMAARDASDSFQNMPDDFSLQPPPERTTVYSADGQVIAQFYYHNRESVSLPQVAPIMQKAIVAIEDARFFQHGPLDFKGSFRALVTNAQDGGIKQGGSTLTQQYVKNLLVENAPNEKEANAAKAPNFGRKLRELRYAVNVEKR